MFINPIHYLNSRSVYHVRTAYKLKREKMYLLECMPNEDSNHPAHPRSLISFRCSHEEILFSLLSKIRPGKILIRQRECAV